VTDKYPKMKTVVVDGKVVPLVYPKGHVWHGDRVIFGSADDEKKYDGSGVPAPATSEQHSAPTFSYVYEQPWWIGQFQRSEK
jgi:hypothetical protein